MAVLEVSLLILAIAGLAFAIFTLGLAFVGCIVMLAERVVMQTKPDWKLSAMFLVASVISAGICLLALGAASLVK